MACSLGTEHYCAISTIISEQPQVHAYIPRLDVGFLDDSSASKGGARIVLMLDMSIVNSLLPRLPLLLDDARFPAVAPIVELRWSSSLLALRGPTLTSVALPWQALGEPSPARASGVEAIEHALKTWPNTETIIISSCGCNCFSGAAY